MNSARSILSSSNQTQTLNLLLRNYAFKSDLKIKWVRPEPIPAYKPQKSGDLEPMKKVNPNDLILEFRNSKELQTADENVRKLFTLQFAPKKYTNRVYFADVIEKVKRHDYDVGSIEVKIARWTGRLHAHTILEQENLSFLGQLFNCWLFRESFFIIVELWKQCPVNFM